MTAIADLRVANDEGGEVVKDNDTDVAPKPLRERADEWMDANPEAMGLFIRFAKDMIERNKRFGAKALAERVRWECAVMTRGDTFKINNNFTAYVARRLIAMYPRLASLMETRETAS